MTKALRPNSLFEKDWYTKFQHVFGYNMSILLTFKYRKKDIPMIFGNLMYLATAVNEVEPDAIDISYLRRYAFPMLNDFGLKEIESECREMIKKVYGKDYDKLAKLSSEDAADLRLDVEMKFFKMKFPKLAKLLKDAVFSFAEEHAKELGIKTKIRGTKGAAKTLAPARKQIGKRS